MKKSLIVYYSWSNGNTKRIAQKLQKETGADIEEIETAVPYSGSYEEVVEQGHREVKEKYTPELKPLTKDLKDYEVIMVGTPTWWYTMTPAVLSFFRSHDLSGKTVIPFMTNGGWPGHVIKDMTKEAKGATVILPKEIQFDSQGGDKLISKESDIDAWVAQVKEFLEK